jgi:hypothetical protein
LKFSILETAVVDMTQWGQESKGQRKLIAGTTTSSEDRGHRFEFCPVRQWPDALARPRDACLVCGGYVDHEGHAVHDMAANLIDACIGNLEIVMISTLHVCEVKAVVLMVQIQRMQTVIIRMNDPNDIAYFGIDRNCRYFAVAQHHFVHNRQLFYGSIRRLREGRRCGHRSEYC